MVKAPKMPELKNKEITYTDYVDDIYQIKYEWILK